MNRNAIVILCLCLVGIFTSVRADKWEVMVKYECDSGCQNKCQEGYYRNWECIKQGGIFPKYAECHCWGATSDKFQNYL